MQSNLQTSETTNKKQQNKNEISSEHKIRTTWNVYTLSQYPIFVGLIKLLNCIKTILRMDTNFDLYVIYPSRSKRVCLIVVYGFWFTAFGWTLLTQHTTAQNSSARHGTT